MSEGNFIPLRNLFPCRIIKLSTSRAYLLLQTRQPHPSLHPHDLDPLLDQVLHRLGLEPLHPDLGHLQPAQLLLWQQKTKKMPIPQTSHRKKLNSRLRIALTVLWWSLAKILNKANLVNVTRSLSKLQASLTCSALLRIQIWRQTFQFPSPVAVLFQCWPLERQLPPQRSLPFLIQVLAMPPLPRLNTPRDTILSQIRENVGLLAKTR